MQLCCILCRRPADQLLTLIVSTKDVILPMSGLVSLRHSAFVLPAPRDVVKLLKSFPIRLSMKHDCFYGRLEFVLFCGVFEARELTKSLENRRDLLAIFGPLLEFMNLFELW